VGKTEKQAFRARYSQYCRDEILGDQSKRIHVAEMLNRWRGYLWFYYATIPSQAHTHRVENVLLAAYLPPCNRTFPSKVRKPIKKLFM